MDKLIRIPRNQTALMQHLQRQVSHGHFFWCADQIPPEKLTGFVRKWAHYGLRADAPARAYRKQCRKASVHLCLSPECRLAEVETGPVGWWMLSTEGKDGLAEGKATPATVSDCRTAHGHLHYLDYELVQLVKEIRSGGKVKRAVTWTWRLVPERYREWEALLVERAKQRDVACLRQAIDCLRAMPMFSGIRVQVKKLIAECNKMLGKTGCPPVVVPEMPVMRMISLWDEQQGV